MPLIPRCRLAEILLRAGRAEEAHPIFAEVKAETPGDVWLYNNAGLEYGAAGDHERALEWLTEGLGRVVLTVFVGAATVTIFRSG